MMSQNLISRYGRWILVDKLHWNYLLHHRSIFLTDCLLLGVKVTIDHNRARSLYYVRTMGTMFKCSPAASGVASARGMFAGRKNPVPNGI